MPSFQSLFGCIGAADVSGPCIPFVFPFPQTAFVLLPSQLVRYQFFDGLAVGIHRDVVVVHRSGQMAFQVIVYLFHGFGGERLVSESSRRMDVQFPSVMVQDIGVQLTGTDVGGGRLVFREVTVQSFFYIAFQTLRRGRQEESGKCK